MITWWEAFQQGRLGHLSSRSTRDEIRAVMGPPEDHAPPRPGSVIFKWGALQVEFHEGALMWLLIEFEGEPVPPALGLDVTGLAGMSPDAFRAEAQARGLELRDVTPEALLPDYCWLAGPTDVYAAFTYEDGLHGLGAPAPMR